MKQVLQNFKSGELTVEEVPPPLAPPGFVLVRNNYSLISAGTEGGTVKLGQMSLLGKARARPEQVRKVLQVVRADGLLTAYQAAMRSLDMPVALGYSCAGQVLDTGPGVTDIAAGHLVACGGGGYASHAEIVSVPRNLCIKVPAGVDLRHAAFATLGSIAMQSVRVAGVRLGENVVVIGLGLVGLLTTQILRAAGCNVFGIDVNPERARFAAQQNFCQAAPRKAANLAEQVQAFSGGYGADAVIITAAAPNNDPVALAGELARYKARVVVVGRTEMTAPRETYLFKELELCTSLAYGPGTGDPSYEEKGLDYPIGYVRWTENRNMAAFLQLIAGQKIQLDPLITHEFEVDDAPRAFQVVTGQAGEPSIAVLLRYPQPQTLPAQPRRISLHAAKQIKNSRSPGRTALGKSKIKNQLRVGVIGAGSHATNNILPALAKLKTVAPAGIVSATGVRAQALGKKYGFEYCAASADELLNDPTIEAVFILSRHDSHTPLTVAALAAGKHVFVEKPLAMTEAELQQVLDAQRAAGLNVMVGFNRRYAALALKLKEFFANHAQPLSMIYRANVGYRPPEHWLHDPQQGGGVIIGEACHMIDFCHWLAGAPPVEVSANKLTGAAQGLIPEDNVHLNFTFADGSLATVAYLSNGSKGYSRERVEVFGENGTGMLEDFRLLELARGTGMVKRKRSLIKQDKGFAGSIEYFIDSVLAGQIRQELFKEQYLSSLITIRSANQILQNTANEEVAQGVEDR